MAADHLRTFCFLGKKLIDFCCRSIEDRNFETVVIHIEDQILSHDCQPDQADITTLVHSFSSV